MLVSKFCPPLVCMVNVVTQAKSMFFFIGRAVSAQMVPYLHALRRPYTLSANSVSKLASLINDISSLLFKPPFLLAMYICRRNGRFSASVLAYKGSSRTPKF